ncbi:unannotated protein [freshwater metagenome]|uniref:Unannotated protein n=1 Tax=freshwater metagenome TaxID=449393 RepID=A0A6J7EDJ3_9ZZZZ
MDWSYPLLAACERHPRRTAIRHRGSALTFGELEERITRTASALHAVGAGGRAVGWLLPTAPAAIEISMGLARAGALAVPLNPRLNAAEIAFICSDSKVEVLIVGPEFAALAEAVVALTDSPPRVFTAQELDAHADPASSPDGWLIDDDAPATVTYTSGTTGLPKGVVRTHRANAWNVMNSALGSPRTSTDVELFTLPAYGIGLLHFAIPVLLGGAMLVLDDEFDAARTWRLLAEERATRAFLAPTMMSSMLEVPGHEDLDLSALEVIYTAYEFSARLRERALGRFGDIFVSMYGLTEAQLTCAAVGDLTRKPGSVGTAMGAARMRVVAEDGTPLPAGEVGEIALHGPSVMSGYHRRPEDTAAALRDGWLHTGDLGFIDADGDLHYAGRSKEMIKTGGFSVDPREVEQVLLGIPGIEQAAVLGIADEHWGEMVIAIVAPTGAVDAAAITSACRERLAGFKVPKRIHELDVLPVNATGKVERGRLRERYAG